jgi:hypothetical protein
MRAPLNFRRHFLLLAAAVMVIALLNLANLFHEPFLPSFALYGALHALCLVLAIPAPPRRLVWRKVLFVGCAAALNVAVLYAGIISLEALGNVLAALRLYLALSICALFGAIAYGFAIRFFWFPELRPRAIAQIALGCMAADVIGMGIQNLTLPFGNWWLVAVWWLAFSGGLWGADRRAHALGPQAHAQ